MVGPVLEYICFLKTTPLKEIFVCRVLPGEMASVLVEEVYNMY